MRSKMPTPESVKREEKIIETIDLYLDGRKADFPTLFSIIRDAERDDLEGVVFHLIGQLSSYRKRERK